MIAIPVTIWLLLMSSGDMPPTPHAVGTFFSEEQCKQNQEYLTKVSPNKGYTFKCQPYRADLPRDQIQD